jgi:hypothetical protein
VFIQHGGNIFVNRQAGYILHVKKIPVNKKHDSNEKWNQYNARYQKPGLGLNFHIPL